MNEYYKDQAAQVNSKKNTVLWLSFTHIKILGIRVSGLELIFHTLQSSEHFFPSNTPHETMTDFIPNAYTLLLTKPTLPTN
jgi:hypothetical protein